MSPDIRSIARDRVDLSLPVRVGSKGAQESRCMLPDGSVRALSLCIRHRNGLGADRETVRAAQHRRAARAPTAVPPRRPRAAAEHRGLLPPRVPTIWSPTGRPSRVKPARDRDGGQAPGRRRRRLGYGALHRPDPPARPSTTTGMGLLDREAAASAAVGVIQRSRVGQERRARGARARVRIRSPARDVARS